jgi:hypothetical protein
MTDGDRAHPGLPIALVIAGTIISMTACAIIGIAWLVVALF